MRIVHVEDESTLQRFVRLDVTRPPASVAEATAVGADEHWIVEDAGGAVAARVSLWWNRVPAHDGHRLGVLGHYAASSDAAAEVLLDTACRRLREAGCTLAVGPMDGNTWHRYRFVTDVGSEPPFFLDVSQPDTWPRQFVHAGFREMARYASSLNPDLARRDPRERERAASVQSAGIHLRSIDLNNVEVDLEKIFEISTAAFAQNFLYTPIDQAEFLRMYSPILPHVRPELVLIAEQGRDAVGFVFCIPDLLEQQRTGRVETVVLKTFGVIPQAMNAGLGSHLAASAQQAARSLGYRRLIYAFMHEDNPSLRISARYGPVIRRYALYCKELDA